MDYPPNQAAAGKLKLNAPNEILISSFPTSFDYDAIVKEMEKALYKNLVLFRCGSRCYCRILRCADATESRL